MTNGSDRNLSYMCIYIENDCFVAAEGWKRSFYELLRDNVERKRC